MGSANPIPCHQVRDGDNDDIDNDHDDHNDDDEGDDDVDDDDDTLPSGPGVG